MIRKRKIRRSVIAAAVALFVASWLVIGVTLVTGHDPALAARSSGSSATASSAQSTTTTAPATTTPTQSNASAPLTTRSS